jgi:hypothetical protein
MVAMNQRQWRLALVLWAASLALVWWAARSAFQMCRYECLPAAPCFVSMTHHQQIDNAVLLWDRQEHRIVVGILGFKNLQTDFADAGMRAGL